MNAIFFEAVHRFNFKLILSFFWSCELCSLKIKNCALEGQQTKIKSIYFGSRLSSWTNFRFKLKLCLSGCHQVPWAQLWIWRCHCQRSNRWCWESCQTSQGDERGKAVEWHHCRNQSQASTAGLPRPSPQATSWAKPVGCQPERRTLLSAPWAPWTAQEASAWNSQRRPCLLISTLWRRSIQDLESQSLSLLKTRSRKLNQILAASCKMNPTII